MAPWWQTPNERSELWLYEYVQISKRLVVAVRLERSDAVVVVVAVTVVIVIPRCIAHVKKVSWKTEKAFHKVQSNDRTVAHIIVMICYNSRHGMFYKVATTAIL